MSAQTNTEKVLRSLHVLLSQSEPYGKEPSKVIVDKQKVLDLLSDLNKCVYEIMDEYELTKQSRDRAEREFHKKGDQIVWDASRKAEDIYAASVMYTDEALRSVSDIMKRNQQQLQAMYEEMERKLKEQEQLVRQNQSELKSQLQDLVDTEKYLKLIEERNQELEKKKAKLEGREPEHKTSIYANRQTEVRVNTEVLEQLGLAPLEDDTAPTGTSASKGEKSEEEIQMQDALDSDYFAWKTEQEAAEAEQKDSPKTENSDSEKASGGIHRLWSVITGASSGEEEKK